MRILGLDAGSARIGVAVSDELGLTAQPLKYIPVKKGGESPLVAIESLCQTYQVKTVVVGLPLSMSGGDKGISSRRAKALGKALEEKLGLEVVYWDERFSSSAANRALIEGNVSRKNRKQVVDKVAASIILQGYLDSRPQS